MGNKNQTEAVSMCQTALSVVRDKAAQTSLNISPEVYSLKFFQSFDKKQLATRLDHIIIGLSSFNEEDQKTLNAFRSNIEILLST